ncbi:NAD-dependent epimerase/dehydratase family protein [Fodinicola acaciae]|uniref:NAD-dependent epimerase/dehydratase family protein n=1 Tax=Fodinicola acaciae TaxID=2681555 RepID=UPI0013CFFB1C|nr:NAD-dependent epimerase/dehydratase family protein [Fodinicola acaciae]
MTVVVIGAGGLIGGALQSVLRRSGVAVTGFTRQSPAIVDGRPHPALISARTVYYLASTISPSNVDGAAADHTDFVRLLDGLTAAGRRPTVVLGSSGGTAYDPTASPPYAEDSPVAPADPYGRAKVRMEDELLARAGQLRPVVLRLANVYGPRPDGTGGFGVVAHWLRAIAEGRPVRLFGDPRTVRDHVFVGDVVDAMLAVRRAAPLPSVLNLGSGRPVSLADLFEVVRAVTGTRPEVERLPSRGRDRPAVWLDVRLARSALDWWARTPLEAGIAQTWRALLDTYSAVNR